MRRKLTGGARRAGADGAGRAKACGALLCLLLTALVAPSAAQEGRRIAPPAGLRCDPNRLTSFTGRVTSYRRTPTRVTLGLRTDEATNERFTVRFARAAGPAASFLLLGEPFRESDWRTVERARGRLRAGMRATVWVCEDGSHPPVVDWRPRDKSPSGVF